MFNYFLLFYFSASKFLLYMKPTTPGMRLRNMTFPLR